MPTPPLVVANWKMNTTREEAHALARAVLPAIADVSTVETALCPPFPWLTEVSEVLTGSNIKIGAQHMYFEDHGAFTGEVSPTMLKGLCDYVLIGQYERRIHFKETEWLIKRTVLAALKHGLRPILCVGEDSDEMEHRGGGAVVARQLEAALEDVPVDGRLVIAYDPPWTTIGRAMPPPPEYSNEICGQIHEVLADLFSPETAADIRVIYGGSVTPNNIGIIAAQPEVDGSMTGIASLRAESFSAIVHAFAGRA